MPSIPLINPGRPPKAWWDKCYASVSKKGARDPAKLCGWIWYHGTSESKKREIMRKYETKRKNILVIPREKLYPVKSAHKGRPYVGVLSNGDYSIFKAPAQPTESSHGKIYRFVIGPFRTVLGAKIMERFGRGNPHIQHVSDAEKFASKGKQWLLDHGFEAAFS